jgi:acyl carrier protein
VGTRKTAEKATRMSDQIRQIIKEHGRLPIDVQALDDHADLYQAGMTSHASVNLMLALEAAFDIEFPDSMLKRSVFQSVASIREALQELGMSAA